MRLSGTKTGAVNQYRGLGNQLWDLAGNRPSLDLPFSDTKSLIDATTGTNLIDFSRASSGTYVGSDGLIKTATTNLLLWSEEFDNASWTKTQLNAFGSGSVANAIAAPNGSIAAELITENTATSFHRVSQDIISGTASLGAYTTSVYFKSKERTRGYINYTDNVTGEVTAVFNLANQSSSVTTAGSWSASLASIQSVGDGWYRCSLTSTKGNSTFALSLRIGIADNSGNVSYTGDGTSGIYLWGAQLEQSSTVGEYIPTTSTINSAPRFDHDPTTGESLGLLVEESRANLLLRSEEFDDASWIKITNGTASTPIVTENFGLAPNGTTTASRLQADRGAGNTTSDQSSIGQTVSGLSDPHTITISIWAKSNTGLTQEVYFRNATGDGGTSITVTTEWQRFTITGSRTGSNSNSLQIGSRGGTNATNSVDILIWGAQLEEGSFPTSYIKNVDNSLGVTRAADVASISGSNFSSWYRQDEGTVFADSQRLSLPPASKFPQVFFASDGTGDNTLNLGYITSSASQFRVRRLGSNEANLLPSTSALRRVTAGAYAANDAAVSEAGADVEFDSSVVLPSALSQLNIGAEQNGNNPLNGTIRRLTYWQTRLPNFTLSTITQ